MVSIGNKIATVSGSTGLKSQGGINLQRETEEERRGLRGRRRLIVETKNKYTEHRTEWLSSEDVLEDTVEDPSYMEEETGT